MLNLRVGQLSNRYIGSLPKIGIRPVLEGRSDLRQSLEKQTLRMADNVAKLLEENLKYTNGRPVECVITNVIAGVTEAAAAAEIFKSEGVGVSITVTPCWAYGFETFDLEPTIPKAIWGLNGTERPGAVYLAAALAGYDQIGIPVFGIYGKDVQDINDEVIPEDVKAKLLLFAKAGLAAAMMRGKSYLSIGGVSMGIAGSRVNHEFFADYLGMRTEYVDMTEFRGRMEKEIYDREEFAQALQWVRHNCIEGEDIANPKAQIRSRAVKDQEWETVIKMALIARDLMIGNSKLAEAGYTEEAKGHNAILAGYQGQRQWTDYYPSADFMEAILNSSFDWTGVREPFVLATENDSLNGAAMLFGQLLTHTAQGFADVRTYWSPEAAQRVTGQALTGKAANGVIHLINSGAAALDMTGEQRKDGQPALKPFWEITPEEARRCLQATRWMPAKYNTFNGGFSSGFYTQAEMPLTISRINIVKGLGPYLQVAEGYSVELPEAIHRVIDQRTDPTWPTTWFAPLLTGVAPFDDVYSVMNTWGANHCAFCYGHIGAELITLAAILRIPVAMHNVAGNRIFRPKSWGAFSARDIDGADYRACAAFGSLYGKKS